MPILPKKVKLVSLFPLMRRLDDKYQSLMTASTKCAPRKGEIPAGGGDWMDNFFRAEAVRGLLTALRSGKSIDEGIADGKAVCQIAIDLWNTRREWQVRRSNCWIDDYLTQCVRAVQTQ